ncbi:Protein ERD1 [Nakaseomyces bracarensis]|uniref:Protein ERD1 n=1 Tax=Nakaseomyces bracarensis TaxID=273131 RepID=A0ABR4NTU0_9SACH
MIIDIEKSGSPGLITVYNLLHISSAQLINVLLLLAVFLWAWVVQFLIRHGIDVGMVVRLTESGDHQSSSNARLRARSADMTFYLAKIIIPLTFVSNLLDAHMKENGETYEVIEFLYWCLPIAQTVFICYYILSSCGILRHIIKRLLFIESKPRALRNVYILFSDTLTSFNKPLIDFILHISYMCGKNPTHFDLVLAVIPPTIRLLQCLKEYTVLRQFTLLANALKYSCHLPIVLCLWYSRVNGDASLTVKNFNLLKVIMFIQSSYSFFWDVKMDWMVSSLTNIRGNKNKATFPRFYYQVAIVLDGIMRYWWLWVILFSNTSEQGKPTALLFAQEVQFIEVIRRGMWSIFKLEAEYSLKENTNYGYQKT